MFDYLDERNPRAAERYLRDIEAAIGHLAATPRAGSARLPSRPDMLALPVRNHIVFYELGDNRIEIVRILHGARDWRSELGSNE